MLIIDHIQTALELVGKLTTIRIPHKDYKFIPLEVGLGTKEIDEDIEVKPINRKEIIIFLKSDIINPYRSYYKTKHGEGIKETFVLFTPDFFDDLEPLDRKYCEKISYKTKTFFAADLDKVQQRCRVFEFLEKIGYAGSKLYGRIDEVYVPPLEYEDMAETLKEKRIVFITGTQEYGKTYTAVRLMWEFYNSGYEPGWIKGGEVTERVEVREKLEDISAELKPGHIIYFEDPFGRTKYERREGLEREIGTIIDTVRHVEDGYVILTSREEVFKEFEKEKLSAKDINELEKKLNIKKPSYDYEKRKEILSNWAEAENCKWLGNPRLKEVVLEAIKDAKSLPTPRSIKDFVMASFDIEKEDKLKEKIKEKSKETAKAFAEEIKNMTDDKLLFLSFLFVSSYFEVELVKATYQELVKELDLKSAWEFDRVFTWFKDDKINISDKHIQFSHPSYFEALPYLLVEDGYITRINKEIFSKLLLKLSERDKAALVVAEAVADNLDKLPEVVKIKLLFKLSESDEAAEVVAKALAVNFNKLPDEVRNKLLFKLSERDAAVWAVAWLVVGNFNKLSEGVQNLLFKLSEKGAAAGAVAREVANNIDELPNDVRNELLVKLSEKDAAAGAVARTVTDNFDKLPEEVKNPLFKLSERDAAAGAVARAVLNNFNTLPEAVRNLLFKLSERDAAAGAVARVVEYNFNKLTVEVRNKLLFKLSEKDTAAWAVARVVADNFNKLPEEVRDLLFTLSEKDTAAWAVAEAVAGKFNKLPEKVRDLLFTLSGKDVVARDVAWAVANNFNKLPVEVRNALLFKLSEKDEAALPVAEAVADNFNKLPREVRNLLFKLSEKDAAARGVAWAVADNFDKLPDAVRNLLDKLQKPLQQVIEILSHSSVSVMSSLQKKEALHLISNALPKLNRDFVLKILEELSKCEDETVRIKALKMLKDIFDDSEGKKDY